jgi:hypothetical protein
MSMDRDVAVCHRTGDRIARFSVERPLL